MSDFLIYGYLWIKALHVISVIAWMAGLLYLPRLFVYHADAAVGSPQSELFKVMERRLFRAIMNPAMIAAYVFGLALLASGLVDWGSGWFWPLCCLPVVRTGRRNSRPGMRIWAMMWAARWLSGPGAEVCPCCG